MQANSKSSNFESVDLHDNKRRSKAKQKANKKEAKKEINQQESMLPLLTHNNRSYFEFGNLSIKQTEIKNWEDFNTRRQNGYGGAVTKINGVAILNYSYTRLFFERYHLRQFLNIDLNFIQSNLYARSYLRGLYLNTPSLLRNICSKKNKTNEGRHNSFLQFGACDGDMLREFNKLPNAKVKGYDYIDSFKRDLEQVGIAFEKIDLEMIDENKKELACLSTLKADLAQSSNIIAVRILEYLTQEALELLIFSLINESKPNSVFFIIGRINKTYFKNLSNNENYIASFFAPRTDIEFVYHTTTRKEFGDENNRRACFGAYLASLFAKNQDDPEFTDEILVLKKLAPPGLQQRNGYSSFFCRQPGSPQLNNEELHRKDEAKNSIAKLVKAKTQKSKLFTMNSQKEGLRETKLLGKRVR